MATNVISPPVLSTTGGQTAVLNEKGQIVIPAELRKLAGLTPGTKIVLWVDGTKLVLQPVEKFVTDLRGLFGPGPSLGDIREKEHRDDKER